LKRFAVGAHDRDPLDVSETALFRRAVLQ